MANIKNTPAQWANAKRLFESGKLLRVISDATGISIPSLSKRAAKEKWQKSTAIPEAPKPDGDIAKQVKAMAAYGLMDDEIATVIGVTLGELRAAYSKELASASPEMVARVAQSMFKMATDANKPNVTAAIFWLKCRGGWNDDPASAKGGVKDQRQEAAKKVGAGKFGAAAPPRLVVSNGRR